MAVGGRVRTELRSFVELLALCGFAIAQPLLDVFGRAPEQFVFRAATRGDIYLFALIVTFGPPVVLWAGEAVIGLASQRLRRGVHLVVIAALVMAFGMQALRSLTTGLTLVIAATIVAVLAVAVYARTKASRIWLQFASLAPIGFVLLFLLSSGTARLLETPKALAVDGGVGNPSPIVMIVLDELPTVTLMNREAEIDAELFPNLAEFSKTSHWYRRTTAVASTTMHAVPAILSGELPEGEASPAAVDHPNNLFTLLAASSYKLDVAETVTRLCPPDLCTPPVVSAGGVRGLLKDVRHVFEARVSASGREEEITATLIEPTTPEPIDPDARDASKDPFHLDSDTALNHPARFAAMLDGLVDDSPTLHYVHLLLPHAPWRYLPDGTVYHEFDSQLGRFADTWEPYKPQLAELGHQRHLLQMIYTDRLIGEVIRTLRERDIYEQSTIVLVADHGNAFDAGKAIRGNLAGKQVSLDTAAQLMYVPFFLKLPGQKTGEIHDENVWTVDVLPTLADILEIDLPWKPDGRSVFDTPRPEGATSFFLNEYRGQTTGLGPVQVADSRELWDAALDVTIDHKYPPGDPLRAWRSGPLRDLIGEKVDSTDVRGRPELEVRYDPGITTDLPNGGRDAKAPILFRGFLESRDPFERVVVAINGTIAASTLVLPDSSFVVLVDPALYKKGQNSIVVYDVNGLGD